MPDTAPPTARQVVANPAAFADQPHLFAPAWGTVLADAGRTLFSDRTGPARHRIEPARPGDLIARIRELAAIQPRRPALICPGTRTADRT